MVLCLVMLVWLRSARWDTRGIQFFALSVVVGGIVWQSLTITHVLTTNRELQAFIVVWDKWLGMVSTFVWAVFVSQYTNDGFHERWPAQTVIGFVTVGYIVFAVVNPGGLVFADIQQFSEPFSFSSVVRGPLYFVFLAPVYGIGMYGFYLLARFMLTTRSGNGIRIALLVVGTVSVTVGNALSILELGPISTFQYGSYGVLLFIGFTTLAVFRLGLFDIAPIARTALVESLSDPVVVVDEDGHVADYNRQARRHWPDMSDHVATPLATACPDLVASLGFDFDAETVTTASSEQITLRDNEGYHHYSVLLSPVTRRGSPRPIGCAILLRDITELEESRQQLQQQNTQLEQVASTISHDLRNPLSVINGYVELLQEEVENEDHATYVGKIDDASERMSAIIEDLLTIAREGQTIEETSEIDFATAAREAWGHVETEQATLVVDRGGQILADRNRLLRIFENLFRNAVEHGSTSPDSHARQDAVEDASTDGQTDGSDTVTVSVGTFDDGSEFAATTDDTAAYGFYVADDGPGIDPETGEQVFEYGFTTSTGGTGLGLSIVSTLAESHGWTVTLDDDYTDGTRFVFTNVFRSPDDTAGPVQQE